MKYFTLFLLYCAPFVASSQCSIEEYQILIKDAGLAQDSGKFDLAINKLSSARVCRPEKEEEINKKLLGVYEVVNKQRDRELKKVREIYANDLANKSQLALQNGDRTSAFRLAEFAHRFTDYDNSNVTRAYLEAVYYNDKPDHKQIPWYSTFATDTFSLVGVFLSPNGRFFATEYEGNAIRVWDLESRKEVLTLPLGNLSQYIRLEKTYLLNEKLDDSSFLTMPSSQGRALLAMDNKMLALLKNDNSIEIWNLLNKEKTLSLLGGPDTIKCSSFSPDGKWFGIGLSNNTTEIWNVKSGRKYLTIKGNNFAFDHLAFSSDGILLAAGSENNTVEIWNLASGKKLLNLPINSQSASASNICFSSDGKKIAIVGFLENAVKIWDTKSGKLIQTISDTESVILCVAFSPDGKKLATKDLDSNIKIWDLESAKIHITPSDVLGSFNFLDKNGGFDSIIISKIVKLWDLGFGNSILSLKDDYFSSIALTGKRLTIVDNGEMNAKIWDLEPGKESMTLLGHSDKVWSVAFSPDGQDIVTAGTYSNVYKTWEIATRQEVPSPQQDPSFGNGYGYTFSRNFKWSASWSSDKFVQIWDLRLIGHSKLARNIMGHTDSVLCAAFSPDSKWLATGSADKTTKIWEVESGKEVITLLGHTNGISSVAFSLDGKKIATGSIDKTIKIWDLTSGREIQSYVDSSVAYSIVFSPTGNGIAVGFLNGVAKVLDLKNGRELFKSYGTTSVFSVTFSKDEKNITVGYSNPTVKVWDFISGEKKQELPIYSSVPSVAISPDGKNLASAIGKEVIIWSIESGKKNRTLLGHTGMVFSIAFSPDGKYFATASGDSAVKVWDLTLGKEFLTLKGHANIVYSVTFSPDGKWLATGSWDNLAKVWDLISGTELKALKGHSGPVYSVAFSPDGNRLATGSLDNKAKIWDLESGKECATFLGHEFSSVQSIAFSPNRRWLAVASDNTAEILDLESGKEVIAFLGHTEEIHNLVFSPDGSNLATASWDKTVKIWQTTPDGWMESIKDKQRISLLSAAQLEINNLEGLLDIRPENEQALLQFGDVWQIAAFADFYTRKIRQTTSPRIEDYQRALHLYNKCLENEVAPNYFGWCIHVLKNLWQEKAN